MKYNFDTIPPVKAKPFSVDDAKIYHGFRGKPSDKIWFGVEKEFEHVDRNVIRKTYDDIVYAYTCNKQIKNDIDSINDLVGDFSIIKYDGSLIAGIEIATAPSSFEYHAAQWKAFYKKLPNLPICVRPNCGMHVHVSKLRLTEKQINNLKFFVKNKQNRHFIEKISNRKSNRYCLYGLRRDSNPHYHALNTSNQNTIEFRFFRTPTSYSVFLKQLSFIKSLVLFGKEETLEKEMSYKSFLTFIKDSYSYKEKSSKTFYELLEN